MSFIGLLKPCYVRRINKDTSLFNWIVRGGYCPSQPSADSPAVVANPKRNRAGSLASLLSDPNTYEAATLDAFLNHSPLSVKGVAAQLSRRGMYPNCTLSVIGQVRRKLKRAGYVLESGKVSPPGQHPYKQWWLTQTTIGKIRMFMEKLLKCSL